MPLISHDSTSAPAISPRNVKHALASTRISGPAQDPARGCAIGQSRVGCGVIETRTYGRMLINRARRSPGALQAMRDR
jgi:hypothetical protein